MTQRDETDHLTVLLIGCGYAGSRFARALRYLEIHQPGLLRFVGACDLDDAAQRAVAGSLPVYSDLVEALSATRPSGIVVAVNEDMHFRVLSQISEFRPRLVMCEKPLTATLAEAEALPVALHRSLLTINFVERQSPVLDAYFNWAASRGTIRPLRVEFFWGKNRLADPRPTIGVLSEITHPIDLVDHIFGFTRFSLTNVIGIRSNYSPHHLSSLDSIDLVGEADDFVVIGHASFAWPRRHRTVTALLTDDTGALFRMTMDFDKPRWDCDHLEIAEVDTITGSHKPMLEYSTTQETTPEGLNGIAKVAAFVRQSVIAASEQVFSDGRPKVPQARSLVGFDQAIKIQRLLNKFEDALGVHTPHFEIVPRHDEFRDTTLQGDTVLLAPMETD